MAEQTEYSNGIGPLKSKEWFLTSLALCRHAAYAAIQEAGWFNDLDACTDLEEVIRIVERVQGKINEGSKPDVCTICGAVVIGGGNYCYECFRSDNGLSGDATNLLAVQGEDIEAGCVCAGCGGWTDYDGYLCDQCLLDSKDRDIEYS